MNFTSSHQLVQIIFQCIAGTSTFNGWPAVRDTDAVIAHENAYVKCKYLHRDVSAGNILIRIGLRKRRDAYFVSWEGILSDWELAKHTDVSHALQPQRTVRHQELVSVFASDSMDTGREHGISCRHISYTTLVCRLRSRTS